MVSRRQWLRGDFGGRSASPRPPWAVARFEKVCSRCDRCVVACPQHILVRGAGGFPEVDFRHGECSFCSRCVEACGDGALVSEAGLPAWSLKAQIGDGCLAMRRVVCRSCGEACGPGAIRFRLAPGGVALPKVSADECNGCGACVGICPVQAMAVAPEEPMLAAAAGRG